MARKGNKYMLWIPRILVFLFVALLALFSLDAITPGASFGENTAGLLAHNIPAIVLLIAAIVSWKREIVGGIVFLLSGTLYVVYTVFQCASWQVALSWSLTIAGPAFLTGALYLVNWRRRQAA
jgi:hypothetical protein